MAVVVIEPPAEIVTLDEVKKHCKIEVDDDNDLVRAYIGAAVGWLDGPNGWLGRALGLQVLEWQLSQWPCGVVRLPFPPEIEILSVKYNDLDGVERDYAVTLPLRFEPAPATRGWDGDIRIRYRAGYGKLNTAQPPVLENSVPQAIKVAIFMLVSQLYETREGVVVGATAEDMPLSVKVLLQPFRVYR
jgi:uncharacterized phiE125 gp8 family phage protein